MNSKPLHPDQSVTSELLVLPDGRVLVHNLTPTFAKLLRGLNPHDEHIAPRTTKLTPLEVTISNELPI